MVNTSTGFASAEAEPEAGLAEGELSSAASEGEPSASRYADIIVPPIMFIIIVAFAMGKILDIVIPPLVFICAILFATLLTSLLTQRLWWSKIFCKRKWSGKKRKEVTHVQSNQMHCVDLKTESTASKKIKSFINESNRNETITESIFTEEDNKIIYDFKCFQNSPVGLLKISLPVILSISFCPVTIYLYPEMIKFFWGQAAGPNVNDAVACFLVPAGIVYAVAFGFTFQDILLKQQEMGLQLKKQSDALKQIKSITECYQRIDHECKKELMKLMKQYVIRVMANVINESCCKNSAELWKILEILQKNEEQLCFKLSETDKKVHQTIYRNTSMLDNFLSSKPNGRNISILQWVFLECLGFISFFGVLLIQAQSYRLELTMCILTVLSVSAFSYVLADFDSPFHGAFKLDLSVYVTYVEDLERLYHSLTVKDRTITKQHSNNEKAKATEIIKVLSVNDST